MRFFARKDDVSGEWHREVVRNAQHWQARANASESQLVWLRAHVDTLTAALIPAPHVAASAVGSVERTHDAVLELVAVKAGSNSARRAHLLNWVKEQRLSGAKDADLRHTLMHWPEYDPGEGDE